MSLTTPAIRFSMHFCVPLKANLQLYSSLMISVMRNNMSFSSDCDFHESRVTSHESTVTRTARLDLGNQAQMKRVCIIGCGSIGSLYGAHLSRVAEVWAFV